MRYLIHFWDKSTKSVSEEEGKAVSRAVVEGKGFILRGAAFAPKSVQWVKPITKAWFKEDEVYSLREPSPAEIEHSVQHFLGSGESDEDSLAN